MIPCTATTDAILRSCLDWNPFIDFNLPNYYD